MENLDIGQIVKDLVAETIPDGNAIGRWFDKRNYTEKDQVRIKDLLEQYGCDLIKDVTDSWLKFEKLHKSGKFTKASDVVEDIDLTAKSVLLSVFMLGAEAAKVKNGDNPKSE